MELPEAPLGKVEMRSLERFLDRRSLEIPPEPDLDIQIIPEDPKEIAVREGIMKEYRQRSIMKTRRWRLWWKKC